MGEGNPCTPLDLAARGDVRVLSFLYIEKVIPRKEWEGSDLTFIDGLQRIHQVLLKLFLRRGLLHAINPLLLDKAADCLGQLGLQSRVSLGLTQIRRSIFRVILL